MLKIIYLPGLVFFFLVLSEGGSSKPRNSIVSCCEVGPSLSKHKNCS